MQEVIGVKQYIKTQKGRSMVEMLGVLAVVGVLSVGAIAGYNYAMRSHRANEMINAVSTLYTTGLSQKGGDGTGELDYETAIGELPAGAKGLIYNDDTTVTLDIADTNDCATVKSKLGEKVVEGDCGTIDSESEAYTLVVAMGEVKEKETIQDEDPEPTSGAPCSEGSPNRCNYGEKTLYQCLDGKWYALDGCGDPDNGGCLKNSEYCEEDDMTGEYTGNYYVCEEGYWSYKGRVMGKCGYEPLCQEGEKRCNSMVKNGSVTYSYSYVEICQNGEWTDAPDSYTDFCPPECTPGEWMGNSARCADNGYWTEDYRECIDGETKCEERALRTCVGGYWKDTYDTYTEGVCGAECTSGSPYKCVDHYLYECNQGRWSILDNC